MFAEGGSVTLLQFYGADKQVDDDGDADLATIVKRRREMAKIAAEDKIKKEREEKIKYDCVCWLLCSFLMIE